MKWIAAVVLLSLQGKISAEQLTLTTWYPAPVGVYQSLITTGGTPSSPVNTILSRDAGNVGIGISSPGAKLHIFGGGTFWHQGASDASLKGHEVVGQSTYRLTTGAPIEKMELVTNDTSGQGLLIDTAGNVRIGSSAALDVPSKLAVVQTGSGVQEALNIASETDGLGNGVAMNFVMGKPGYNQEPEGRISAVLVGPYGNASDSNLVFYARGGNVLNEGLRITNYGNIGLGTSNPQASLDVQTNTTGNGPGLRVGGTCVSGYCPSDRALKTDIQYLSGSLGVIERLKPARFRYKDDSRQNEGYGLIAQDVQKVAPEFVHKGKDGYLRVDYSSIEMMLVDAVRELKAENEALREENKKLEGEIGEILKKPAAESNKK